ncbi:uncharacterized protein LOC109542582 [Dendroctonus ponderosae]|uniref:Uncharacterized protein n=2 Tax=Dendroctonus ponderosae TaxID=77166 RepID=A0AAR5Q2F1_DENPD|nr:uncharacterized protein LOC109542582 [Dendroctonus ponderosae]
MKRRREEQQKHEETPKPTTLEVCEQMCKVAMLRREGPKLLHEILTAETEARMKWLRNLKFEIPAEHKTLMPDLPVISAPNFEQKQKRYEEQKRLLTLISVYEMQAKCPVARIIDKI